MSEFTDLFDETRSATRQGWAPGEERDKISANRPANSASDFGLRTLRFAISRDTAAFLTRIKDCRQPASIELQLAPTVHA